MSPKLITTLDIRARKRSGDKLVMVTAYDATFASILDGAGVDMMLVGDSLGMVIQGHQNTLPVTLDHVIYHTAAVTRGSKRAHIVGDMPFMSYQVSPEQAVISAGRLIQEGGAHAVKLEGGFEVVDAVERIVGAGIPVMGHIGLTPQSVHAQGGFRVQGRDVGAARRLLGSARALESAGCYSLVLEGIPAELATQVSSTVGIPTIGIGAGAGCDGQVLVCYDLISMNPTFKPKFVKTYANAHEMITNATKQFVEDVRAGTFPGEEHSFHAPALRQGPIGVVAADATTVSANTGKAGTGGLEPGPADDEDTDMKGIYGVPV